MQVSYWDARVAREIVKALAARRLELIDQLAVGVSYDIYNQQVGRVGGLEEAIQIVGAVLEKLGPENE
jgi:hypothetical protein